MKKEKTLVIMAAGMGSRFGGLKQIEPIGPNGEFIIDYSIYDAIRAGFSKVVFIIKEENYQVFKDTIGKRVEDKIPTFYAFQKLDNVPEGVTIPDDRVKPWGTGQAILSAREFVDSSFVVINADDFYGYDAYLKAANFIDNNDDFNMYANIAYNVSNTLTENGSVKRGVLTCEDGYLTSIVESKIEKKDEGIVAEPLNGDNSFIVSSDALVSMNMFVFTEGIFKYLEEGFKIFFDKNKNDLLKCEYLLPDVVSSEMNKKNIKVKVVNTSATWYGVTYKEDKDFVVSSIKNLVDEMVYPNDLWK